MSSPISPSQGAFQALEVNLKTVLLHTGSALSNASKADGINLVSTRTQLEKTLPGALRKWHGALNDLEEQLWNAKATLHRDLDALRRSKSSTTNHISQTSPAQSLDSDTVMVEAPSEQHSSPASAQGININPDDASKDGLTLVEDNQKHMSSMQTPTSDEKDTPNTQTSALQDQTTHANTPSRFLLQEYTQKETSISRDHEASLATSMDGASSPMDLLLPSIGAATVGSSLNDVASDFSTSDVGQLLPGLMDYANEGMTGSGDIGEVTGGLNLDDFSADHLFSNTIGQLDTKSIGAGDDLDDLFGEGDFGGSADANTLNQNAPGSFVDTSFNFNDLITNDDLNLNSAESTTFDPSFFGDDFFKLDTDGTSNET